MFKNLFIFTFVLAALFGAVTLRAESQADGGNIQQQETVAADNAAEEEDDDHYDAGRGGFYNFISAVGHAILWYLPNRISDLTDCLTFEVGVGEIGLNLYLTRFANFGAGVGHSYMLGWSIRHQNGIYREQSWYANFLKWSGSETNRASVYGDYVEFRDSNSEYASLLKMYKIGAEDPLAIGIKAGCYVGLKVQFNPSELVDFVAGCLFIDLMDDDN